MWTVSEAWYALCCQFARMVLLLHGSADLEVLKWQEGSLEQADRACRVLELAWEYFQWQ